MNKNQVKGSLIDFAGKVQERTGQFVGSKEQQVNGFGKQISGKAEKIYGNAKAEATEVIKDSNNYQ